MIIIIIIFIFFKVKWDYVQAEAFGGDGDANFSTTAYMLIYEQDESVNKSEIPTRYLEMDLPRSTNRDLIEQIGLQQNINVPSLESISKKNSTLCQKEQLVEKLQESFQEPQFSQPVLEDILQKELAVDIKKTLQEKIFNDQQAIVDNNWDSMIAPGESIFIGKISRQSRWERTSFFTLSTFLLRPSNFYWLHDS